MTDKRKGVLSLAAGLFLITCHWSLVTPMRAVQLTAVNQLSVVDVPEPKPGPGDVLIALRAAALNHRDAWIKCGQYAGLRWPCIPGSDGAGVVVACGDQVDPTWQGREVIINPSFGWGGHEQVQGPDFSILGLPRQGTLAERIAVPVGQVSMRPTHLTWEESAALPLAGLTAYRALFSRAKLQPGERLLVSGVGGGAALFALQFAVAAGAEVWVTSSSEAKIAAAIERGAKGGFNYTDPEWAKKATREPGFFDVVIDSAGGEGFEQLLDAAKPGGRVVFFGATRGNPPVLPMRKIFWRQLTLLGTTMGSPQDWEAMVDFVAKEQVRPVVSAAFPLAQAGEAFALMDRGAQFGKIVVRIAE